MNVQYLCIAHSYIQCNACQWIQSLLVVCLISIPLDQLGLLPDYFPLRQMEGESAIQQFSDFHNSIHSQCSLTFYDNHTEKRIHRSIVFQLEEMQLRWFSKYFLFWCQPSFDWNWYSKYELDHWLFFFRNYFERVKQVWITRN